jgi:hypothetical protein
MHGIAGAVGAVPVEVWIQRILLGFFVADGFLLQA